MKISDLRVEREKRRRSENRRTIVRAAERVILRKGYGAVTMDDVAGEAQFSKATVYRYFRNKGDLLLEIMIHYFDDVRKRLAEIASEAGPASAKLRNSILFILEFHEDKNAISQMVFMDPAMFRMMRVFFVSPTSEEASPLKAFLDMVKEKKAASYREVARILREGMDSGEFRDLDIPSALRFIDAAVQGYIHGFLWNEDRDDSQTAADFLHAYILRGIGAGDSRRTKGAKR